MKTTPKQKTQLADTNKRLSLKRLTGLAVLSLPITLPSIAAATTVINNTRAASLEGMLVSKEGVPEESLILRNFTNHNVTIKNFSNGKFLLDRDVVNCNEACLQGPVVIPAGQSILVQFKPNGHGSKLSLDDNFIYADSDVKRLSEGTRVIQFRANVSGNNAVISLRSDKRQIS